MYKIFINEKPFIISDSDISDEYYSSCTRVTHDPLKMLGWIKDCESMSGKGFVVIADDELYAFKDFYSHFVSIEAAGGVVFNTAGQLLLIKRLGKWDLPKGKIDGEESPDQAAIREVEEECSIGELDLNKALPVTYHTYRMHNHRFLKITYWFSMYTTWDKEPKPQLEENITEAKWFNLQEIDLEKLDTYNSIRDLLRSIS